jgi:hypothetical protein
MLIANLSLCLELRTGDKVLSKLFVYSKHRYCRYQWPFGLRRGSAAARLLGLLVRIPPKAWFSVSCECCVLSGRGLSVGLITRPEES